MLRTHQEEALKKIQESTGKSFLLADSVGLGKTRVACAYAKNFKSVLIVAPLSTLGNWKSEAEAVGLDQVEFPKVMIINYEKLKKVEANFDLIIWDECHFLKSYKSLRHKIWISFQKMNCKHLYLSATPAQNPLEMKYLYNIIGIPLSGYWDWVKSFGGISQPSWGGYKFEYGYQKDKDRLQGILNGPNSIRRTPEEIADWPELNRIVYPVVLDAENYEKYQSAFKDYMLELEAVGKKIKPESEKLVAVGQFRQRISHIKIGHTIEMTENLMNQGYVVTLNCEYLEAVGKIAEYFDNKRIGIITGETSPSVRQLILDQSKNDLLDLIIFTIKEGINLQQFGDSHRSRVQINHDMKWSAMDQTQVDGRCHRAGRYAPVYYVVCKGTIDEKVARVMKSKMDSMHNMMDENNDQMTLDLIENSVKV